MGALHRVKVFPLEQITDEVGNYIYTGEAEARDIKGETSESAQTMPALWHSLTPSELGQVTCPLKIPL